MHRIYCVLCCALAFGCAEAPNFDAPTSEVIQEAASSARLGPAGIAPAGAGADFDAKVREPTLTRVMLRRSAAVIEGTVGERRYEYHEDLGPRTVIDIDVKGVVAGELASRSLKVSTFGGPTNDGKWMSTSGDVVLEQGERYLLFLSNETWNLHPFTAAALRIVEVAGRELLVNQRGNPLLGFSPEGFVFRGDSLLTDNGARVDTSRAPGELTGVIDRARFVELLGDAIAGEGVAPSGRFTLTPTAHGPNWRLIPPAVEDVERAAAVAAATEDAITAEPDATGSSPTVAREPR